MGRKPWKESSTSHGFMVRVSIETGILLKELKCERPSAVSSDDIISEGLHALKKKNNDFGF